MIREAIDRIIELNRPEVIEIDNRKYSPSGLNRILDPIPEMLKIHTLTGLVDYYKKFIDKDDEKTPIAIHVVSHNQVDIIGSLKGAFLVRPCFLTAINEKPSYQFGNRDPLETFIVRIQSMFVQDETTALILKLVSNLKQEDSINNADDGVSQEVTIKTGIAKVEDVTLPNPVTLKPYRTFLEVEQPESKFVFRMDKVHGLVHCSLYEADGGGWELDAIETIKAWLSDNIIDTPIIA